MNTREEQNTVVMIRHAQSEWNRQGRFTGWADPQLTAAGREEAVAAGRRLAEGGYRFDQAYSSRLSRAQATGRLVLRHSRNEDVPMRADWRLNERHYGALQGLSKVQMASRVGEEQVWRWRRSYLERPPVIAANDPQHPAHQAQWNDIPTRELPNGENLAQTRARVMAFWDEVVVPQLAEGRRILIASHGNTLRALLMGLEDMSVAQVESFEIPTGVPIAYRFGAHGEPLGWRYLDPQQRVA
jgi:2,3-bisphosphoglycerate-dependent phosphoglycerate mutase